MILTVIDDIPLYSTIREAVSWGRRNNIQGYHTHTYNNRLGYMAGDSHSVFVKTAAVNPPTPTPLRIITPQTTPVANNTNTNTNTGGSGY